MAAKLTLAQELSYFLGYSLQEMMDLKQQGRISDRLYGKYILLWRWSAIRYEDDAQTRFYNRMGSDAYWRRIDRGIALLARLRALPKLDPRDVPFALGVLHR